MRFFWKQEKKPFIEDKKRPWNKKVIWRSFFLSENKQNNQKWEAIGDKKQEIREKTEIEDIIEHRKECRNEKCGNNIKGMAVEHLQVWKGIEHPLRRY